VLKVEPSPLKVVIQPATPTVDVGQTVVLDARLEDQNGLPHPSTFRWTTADESIATVNEELGVVTGVAGKTQITATDATAGKSGSVSVTVEEGGPTVTGRGELTLHGRWQEEFFAADLRGTPKTIGTPDGEKSFLRIKKEGVLVSIVDVSPVSENVYVVGAEGNAPVGTSYDIELRFERVPDTP
jgi:hypothetical protein